MAFHEYAEAWINITRLDILIVTFQIFLQKQVMVIVRMRYRVFILYSTKTGE